MKKAATLDSDSEDISSSNRVGWDLGGHLVLPTAHK